MRASPLVPSCPGRSVETHIVCLLRVLLLLPVAACVLVAWLAAAVLATVWVVLTALVPLRGRSAPSAGLPAYPAYLPERRRAGPRRNRDGADGPR